MAELRIAANLPYCDESNALGDALNDPDAWRYMVKLWAHQLLHENEEGFLNISSIVLKQVCGWKGQKNRLLSALKSSKFVVEKDGKLYMRGWSRNRRYLQEKRVRREREKERRRAKRDGHDPGTKRRPPTLSLSLSHECVGEEQITPDIVAGKHTALHEVEQAGYTKYGQLAGSAIPALRRLLPITHDELEAAMRTNGRSWVYAARVIEGCRKEDSRPTAPVAKRRYTADDYSNIQWDDEGEDNDDTT